MAMRDLQAFRINLGWISIKRPGSIVKKKKKNDTT